MPRTNRPKRNPYEQDQVDAFDMVGDQMNNLANDDFYETVKIKEVRETIRNWMYMPRQGSRRVDPADKDVQFELSSRIFNAMEELFQQYSSYVG